MHKLPVRLLGNKRKYACQHNVHKTPTKFVTIAKIHIFHDYLLKIVRIWGIFISAPPKKGTKTPAPTKAAFNNFFWRRYCNAVFVGCQVWNLMNMSFRWALTAAGIRKPPRAVTRGGVQEIPLPTPAPGEEGILTVKMLSPHSCKAIIAQTPHRSQWNLTYKEGRQFDIERNAG